MTHEKRIEFYRMVDLESKISPFYLDAQEIYRGFGVATMGCRLWFTWLEFLGAPGQSLAYI